MREFRTKLEDTFAPVWNILSAKYAGIKIREHSVIDFLMAMKPPLGFKDTNARRITVAKVVNEMNLTM